MSSAINNWWNKQFNNKMAIIAKKTERKERPKLPVGNYMAQCSKVIHIGTKTKYNEVALFFEILGTEGEIYEIEKIVALSTHPDSTMRKMLNTWRGRDMTEEEAEAFDISKVLAAKAMVTVGLTTATGFEKNEILSINPMPKGMVAPEGKIPPQTLDYENWDSQVFEALPNFIKNKITATKEYQEKWQTLATNP